MASNIHDRLRILTSRRDCEVLHLIEPVLSERSSVLFPDLFAQILCVRPQKWSPVCTTAVAHRFLTSAGRSGGTRT